MSDSHEAFDFRSEVKNYVAVFIALAVLTIATWAISLVHLSVIPLAISIGLLVALVKGSLVALFFMHLSHERKFIYGALLLTLVLFLTLLFLPLISNLGSNASDEHIYTLPEPAPAAGH
jgi:cytochrome c oxidase subunit 4